MRTEHTKTRDAGTVDLWEIIHLFRDNLGKIALSVLFCGGLAGLYLTHARPVYASTAMLEAAPGDQQNSNTVDLDASDVLKTIELKIASQSVLWDVIKSNHLAEDADFAPPRNSKPFYTADLTQWLEEKAAALFQLTGANRLVDALKLNLSTPSTGPYSDAELIRRLAAKVSVNLVRGSRLISLTVEDHDAQKAQRLAQAVIDEFFQQSWNDRSKDIMTARQLLLAEVRRVSGELKTSEEKLEAYREKYHAVSLQERQNIVVERLRDLNQQVLAAQNTRMAMEPEAERVRRLLDSDPAQLLGLRNIAELQEIIDLRKQITSQEAQIAMLAKRYGPLHPTMIQAQSQLHELRSSLQTSLQKAGHRILLSYESAQATEAALKAALDKQQKASLELDRIAIPYHTLER
ncbi:MAG: hypothetical protein KGJ37_01545, partial [Verrucomicrobiota bacterium]|nr:hypothetical protein [Verrucomicrobiota bacterium]